jgi:hypothetical protein
VWCGRYFRRWQHRAGPWVFTIVADGVEVLLLVLIHVEILVAESIARAIVWKLIEIVVMVGVLWIRISVDISVAIVIFVVVVIRLFLCDHVTVDAQYHWRLGVTV